MTPTKRTRAWLKKRGIESAIVEKWNAHARVHQDVFGFIDMIALEVGEIVAIQVTSGPNVSARCKKIVAEPRALKWLQSGGRIVVHGWTKRTKAGRCVGYALRVARLGWLEHNGFFWTEETIEPRGKKCN